MPAASAVFERHGFVVRSWDKVRTDTLTWETGVIGAALVNEVRRAWDD